MTAKDVITTQPSDESTGNTVCPDVRELAARLLANTAAAVSEPVATPPSLDTISQSRYRDEGKVETDRLNDVKGDAKSSSIEGDVNSMKKAVDLAKQLRKAIRQSGLTRNQIAKRADLSYAIVHGFVAGTKDLRLETASKIAAVVGVELHALDGTR